MASISQVAFAARSLASLLLGDERKNAGAVAEAFIAILQRLAARKIQTMAEQASGTALVYSSAESDSD